MSDQIMEELWNGISTEADGVEFVNSVIDRQGRSRPAFMLEL
jgi:hypothetical protein